MKITILGSGSAYGSPNVFNFWGNIEDNQNMKNHRTRASCVLQVESSDILIDMTPEFRMQINKNNINNIDAVFLTHGHYDHIASVPELWRVASVLNKQIHVFCHTEIFNEIKLCFPYLFKQNHEKGCDKIIWHSFGTNESIEFNGLSFKTFQVKHGRIETTAFRYKNIAIVMDLESLSLDNKEQLKDLDLLLIECNNGNECVPNGHNNLPQTKEWVKELNPKKTILTHLSIRVDDTLYSKELPDNIELAYDGMIINLI